MYKYDINEAAAAVAANRRMSVRDAWDIACFALYAMAVISAAIVMI